MDGKSTLPIYALPLPMVAAETKLSIYAVATAVPKTEWVSEPTFQ